MFLGGKGTYRVLPRIRVDTDEGLYDSSALYIEGRTRRTRANTSIVWKTSLAQQATNHVTSLIL